MTPEQRKQILADVQANKVVKMTPEQVADAMENNQMPDQLIQLISPPNVNPITSRDQVPPWIIECAIDIHHCQGEDLDVMFGRDRFRETVETITHHYFYSLDGQWRRVNLRT